MEENLNQNSDDIIKDNAAIMIQKAYRNHIKRKTQPKKSLPTMTMIDEVAKKLMNRKKVAEELLQTEKLYVQNLNIIVTVFMEPMKTEAPFLAEKYLRIVFGNIKDIQLINAEILNSLETQMTHWQPEQPLMNVFLKNLDFLKLYTIYCSTHQNAIDTLSKSKQCTPFFKKCQIDHNVSMDLSSFLIMPVQRLPRYKLLFEQLLKYTPEEHEDYPFIKAAVEKVSAVASQVNEGVREKETQTFLEEMEKKFVGTPVKLVKPGRRLVKEGVLTKICRKDQKKKYFWLFNDILIYGLRVDSNRFLLHNQVNLEKTRCFSLDDTKAYSNALQVLSKEKSFIVFADSVENRDEWLHAIQQSIADPTGRFVKLSLEEEEVDDIAPVWMPDSTATKCLLCETTFTMFRRRHHCRRCGKLVCGNCSTHTWKLENLRKQCRVCDECFESLSKSNLNSIPPMPTSNSASNLLGSSLDSSNISLNSSSSTSIPPHSSSSTPNSSPPKERTGPPPIPPKPSYLRVNKEGSGVLKENPNPIPTTSSTSSTSTSSTSTSSTLAQPSSNSISSSSSSSENRNHSTTNDQRHPNLNFKSQLQAQLETRSPASSSPPLVGSNTSQSHSSSNENNNVPNGPHRPPPKRALPALPPGVAMLSPRSQPQHLDESK